MKSIASLLVSVFLFLTFVPAASAQTPPDVVRTTDGGMFRGTILEFVPGDHLVLLLPSGETRRFTAAEIQSTESAAPAPTPAPAATTPPMAAATPTVQPTNVFTGPTVGGNQVRLRVTTPDLGTSLMLRTGVAAGMVGTATAVVVQYDRLCTAPCELTLDRGNHTFAVEDARGRQRAVRRPVYIDRDGTLDISVESRRRQRVVRWLVGLGTLAVGVPLLMRGLNTGGECEDDFGSTPCRNWGLVAVGSAALAAGYTMVMVAAFTWDRGKVEFRPD